MHITNNTWIEQDSVELDVELTAFVQKLPDHSSIVTRLTFFMDDQGNAFLPVRNEVSPQAITEHFIEED